MKAVTITSQNQYALVTRYGKEDLTEFPIGYIMVANFGDNGEFRYEGVLTPVNFDDTFVKTKALKNGFYEVSYK